MQSFNKLIKKIDRKSNNTNTGHFDKLLLDGDYVQNIYNSVKNRGYHRQGRFIQDRTFWGHIGVRIRDEGFVICINDKEILHLTLSEIELKDYFERNVYIKLIGCNDDIVEGCTNNSSTHRDDKNENLYSQVQYAISDSPENRRERLSKASRLPRKTEIKTWVFVRNPDVVAEVLIRAVGVCESCKEPAPFNRKSDSSPYLEVHHKITLSEGGEDTVENAIALCPNCHRREHYG